MSSTRSDAELLDALDAILGRALTIKLDRIWLPGVGFDAWQVAVKAQFEAEGYGFEVSSGGTTVREALERVVDRVQVEIVKERVL